MGETLSVCRSFSALAKFRIGFELTLPFMVRGGVCASNLHIIIMYEVNLSSYVASENKLDRKLFKGDRTTRTSTNGIFHCFRNDITIIFTIDLYSKKLYLHLGVAWFRASQCT